jgi:hypothetical protein
LAGVVATILIVPFAIAGPFRKTDDFKGILNAGDAVKLAQKQLIDAGKPEYATLLSEERVRAAVRNAVKSYELTAVTITEKRVPGTKEHFEKEIKPVCLRVAERGEWPPGCSLDAYFALEDERHGEKIAYDGMGLRLLIETPNSKFEGFALPVLMLFYGRVEPMCE